jgi:DNA-directed RNA polymerase subunit M/transcription elongation factor TFIIS
MFVKIKVSCPCHCTYTVNEDINSDKIICPNCGKEYPYSDKMIAMLKLSKEIPDGDFLLNEHSVEVISLSEYMNSRQ